MDGRGGHLSNERHFSGLRGRDAAGRTALLADQRANEALAGLWQHGRIVFPTAAFLPGSAALTTGDGREVKLYQLAPNLVEPANLPADGFSGALVYIGAGRPEQVAGKQLTGAAVVVEFNSARRWIDAVALGAEGVVSVVSNEAPAEMAALISATRAGDLERARSLHFRLLPLMTANFAESNPVPVKTAMSMLGHCDGRLRPPLGPPDDETRVVLERVLRTAGLSVDTPDEARR